MKTMKKFAEICETIATMVLLSSCACTVYIAVDAIGGQWGMIFGTIPMTDLFIDTVRTALLKGLGMLCVGWIAFAPSWFFSEWTKKKDKERV